MRHKVIANPYLMDIFKVEFINVGFLGQVTKDNKKIKENSLVLRFILEFKFSGTPLF